MRFHSMKMAEINKIIKDLWMKIYKGGGIYTGADQIKFTRVEIRWREEWVIIDNSRCC